MKIGADQLCVLHDRLIFLCSSKRLREGVARKGSLLRLGLCSVRILSVTLSLVSISRLCRTSLSSVPALSSPPIAFRSRTQMSFTTLMQVFAHRMLTRGRQKKQILFKSAKLTLVVGRHGVFEWPTEG